MQLIIAEKPSVAQSIATVLGTAVFCKREIPKKKWGISLLQKTRESINITRISHVDLHERVFFCEEPKQPQNPIRKTKNHARTTNNCKAKDTYCYCFLNKYLNKTD
jgi:DNA topoisomerase IA